MVSYDSENYRKQLKRERALVKRSFDKRDKLAKEWTRGKILELGCGEYPLFENSTKVDIAKIDGCVQADCNYRLPLKEKFDTIIALELIEHLWNIDDFLEECNRLLKKDGLLIISTINVKYWKTRLMLLLGNSSHFGVDGIHLVYFSPESLRRKLSEHGFIVETMEPLGRMKLLNLCGGFVTLAHKPSEITNFK